jgi:hypothetical protein
MQKSLFTFIKAAVLVASFVGIQAQAISIRAKSKIFSSGPKIYICNAGVSTAQPQGQVCYFNGNPANPACTPLSCDKAKENCNTNCICTTDPGQSYPARLEAKGLDYNNNNDSQAVPYVKNADGMKMNSIYSGSDAWSKRIFDIATYFAQEIYNGSYFMDICYRGSQIPNTNGWFQVTTQASAIPFEVLDAQGFKSLDNNRNFLNFDISTELGKEYTSKANLTVQRYVRCGATQAAAEFTLDGATGLPNNASSVSTESPMTVSAQTVEHGGFTDPKFCKVRYVFRETNYKSPINLRLPRDHKAEGAEVCTYTKINDPKPQEGDQGLQ